MSELSGAMDMPALLGLPWKLDPALRLNNKE